MLTGLVAHAGPPAAPHDLWAAWSFEPLVVATLLLAGWAHRRGSAASARDPAAARRTRSFVVALLVAAVALVSPLEALAGVLASAHMVQHVLLVLVVAPLLALSAPSAALLRGLPLPARRTVGGWRRRLRPARAALRPLDHPAAAWLLHVATLWFWHASVPYDGALRSEPVHVLQHLSFVLTAVLFWRVVLSPRGAVRVAPGLGVLLVFTMALQSVFLSALLTFASEPWYSGYPVAAMAGWGLDPLSDQQLAGLIMWVPAGVVYLVAALALLAAWVRSSEPDLDPPRGPGVRPTAARP